MIGLPAFCARFGIDPAAARAALDHHDERGMPWYAQALVGAGGWLSAIAIIVFVVAFLTLAIGIEEPWVEAIIAGLALFGAGVIALASGERGLFASHFIIAMAAAGAALATGGIGFEIESLWAAAAMAALLTGVGAAFAPSLILQFLLAALAMALAVLGLEQDAGDGAIDLIAVATPVGLWLTLRPPRQDLRALAAVLLLAVPLAAAALDLPALSWTASAGWVARAIHLALLLALIAALTRSGDGVAGLVTVCALLLAAIVALLLPAGAMAGLFLMLLAYTIGHRAYAVIGAGLAVWFIWQFYYALEMTLLQKSLLLAAVGAGCLALHALLSLRGRTA
jgi:hypothetical protein